jgi:hypothetical protein
MRPARWFLLGLALLPLAACSDAVPSKPSSTQVPSQPSANAVRIIIKAPSELLQGAAPAQASAYTEFEDGSQIDLKQAKCQMTWSSSAPAVATVFDGLIEPKGEGLAEAPLRVRRRIVGVVVEYHTNEPIANATVTVADGRDVSRQAIADSDGRFVLGVLDATFTLQATAPEFETEREMIAADQSDVRFRLEPAELEFRWSGTFDKAKALGAPPQGLVTFETHHKGGVTIRVRAGCNTAGTYDDWGAWISDQHEQTVMEAVHPWDRGTDRQLLPPGRYTLHIKTDNAYADDGCQWHVTLTRPS